MFMKRGLLSLQAAWPRQKLLSVCLVFLSLILTAYRVHAAVPRTLSLQGVITDENTDLPLNSTESVLFKLYDVSTGAVVLWQETHTIIFVDGLYQVTLGANLGNPLPEDLFHSGKIELGLTIGADVELQPRLRIQSVPFAFEAITSENATGDTSRRGR